MKKKIFLLPCIAAVAIATFVGAKSFKTNASESNELLMQNVEALSKNADASGGYTKSTGNCSAPCHYKKWVSCASGGPDECYPSDCC